MKDNFTFVYFGGEPLGAPVLSALLDAGMVPALVVTNPDRPVGRQQTLTPPPTKTLTINRDIPVFQPETCKDPEAMKTVTDIDADVYVVVAYNHILPKWLIDTPPHGAVNVHPSLLPKYRGPNPICAAILHDDADVGVSVMVLDEKMDHGPILAQEKLEISDDEWPLPGRELDGRLAKLGGQLLVTSLPQYFAGEITPKEQNHDDATYTHKMTRQDGELALDPLQLPTGDAAYQTYLKICAYDGWPETFFIHEGKRVKIKEAELALSGELCLRRVIPEGKAEMDFAQYLQSLV